MRIKYPMPRYGKEFARWDKKILLIFTAYLVIQPIIANACLQKFLLFLARNSRLELFCWVAFIVLVRELISIER